jgi:hypothetical protein
MGTFMHQELYSDPVFLKLQFSQKWIELGLLSAVRFELIKHEYLTGEDAHAEHYRWNIFREFVTDNDFISEETFLEIYQLGEDDPDYSMGRAMRFDLIKRLDCPTSILEIALNGTDPVLAKHASKYKKA